jgi:hypothetical protein
MRGRELRNFALECLKAARQTRQIVDKESYRVIAESLIRRANEVDEVIAPINAPARLPNMQRIADASGAPSRFVAGQISKEVAVLPLRPIPESDNRQRKIRKPKIRLSRMRTD